VRARARARGKKEEEMEGRRSSATFPISASSPSL